MNTPLNTEQRIIWNRKLTKALNANNRGAKLTPEQVKIVEWHQKYVRLMAEKLKLI